MNGWLEQIDTTISAHTLRRLQGAFDLGLAEARARLRATGSLRERVALLAEVQRLEAAIARCRAARAAKARQTGWQHLATRRNARPAHAATYRRDDAPSPTLADAVSQPPPAARVGAGPGVAGAAPPSGMGHGWPALASGAGSAAARSGRSDGTPPASPLTARHPDNPSFCSENEGISPNVCECEDIHYAQLRDWICRSPC